MSTLLSKKPISVVIFDRTQAGFSDVPVFAQKLKEKVNTPLNQEVAGSYLSPGALKILGAIKSGALVATSSKLEASDSVLRADSSGGQTGEFAQSTDVVATSDQRPVISVQNNQPSHQSPVASLELVDDPALDRTIFASLGLDDILIKLQTVELKVPTLKLLPFNPMVLDEVNNHGIVDRVILPLTKASVSSNYVELARFKLHRLTRTSRDLVAILLSIFHAIGATVLAVRLPELQKIQISKFPIVLAAVNLPKIPKIQITKIEELVRLFHIPEFNFARFTSKVLIAGSLVLMLMTVGPMVALELQSYKQKISYAITNLPTRAEDSSQGTTETKPTPIPSANPDPDKQFQIIIPKIGVNSKVIANVDPGDEKAYGEALKKGVAHAAGTGLPGEANTDNKTIFIFGHSTNGEWNIARYNALFYALKDMIVDDTFSVWFWGKEYHYKVTKTEVVAADDVSFLIPQTAKDQLILQTCWPPGTSWKRFLVIAEPLP